MTKAVLQRQVSEYSVLKSYTFARNCLFCLFLCCEAMEFVWSDLSVAQIIIIIVIIIIMIITIMIIMMMMMIIIVVMIMMIIIIIIIIIVINLNLYSAIRH